MRRISEILVKAHVAVAGAARRARGWHRTQPTSSARPGDPRRAGSTSDAARSSPTHIGDLKTYAFRTKGAENAAVEFDDETLEPKYRLHVGDIGQSKALKIARQLRLPEQSSNAQSLTWPSGEAMECPIGSFWRNCARRRELARQGGADRTGRRRENSQALAQRLAQLHDEAERTVNLADARALIQMGDQVVVPRLGL